METHPSLRLHMTLNICPTIYPLILNMLRTGSSDYESILNLLKSDISSLANMAIKQTVLTIMLPFSDTRRVPGDNLDTALTIKIAAMLATALETHGASVTSTLEPSKQIRLNISLATSPKK